MLLVGDAAEDRAFLFSALFRSLRSASVSVTSSSSATSSTSSLNEATSTGGTGMGGGGSVGGGGSGVRLQGAVTMRVCKLLLDGERKKEKSDKGNSKTQVQ